jgi:hypothetical protein
LINYKYKGGVVMSYRYLFSAHFAGRMCEKCLVHFSKTKVSIFRSREQECPDRPRLKDVFTQLAEDDFKKMQSSLLAEGKTDEGGNVEIEIDPEQNDYQGECIEVVITFERLVGQDKELDSPEHFLIARYQPQWELKDRRQFHFYDFVFPASLWCAYLKKHDIWAICGRVTTCTKPDSPVGGVTVKAYDADWTQHDSLGEDVTDANGWFIIYYDRASFTRTPFPAINLEWESGPDVYFGIEGVDAVGNPIILLDEPPSRGRKPDRENVSNCFCVHLCATLLVPLPDQVPMWTHIGNYQIPDSVNMHDFRAEGYTQSGDLAFYSNLTFIGQTGTATATRRLRYRFLYAEWTGLTAPTPTTPVTKDMIASTKVGQIIVSTSPLILEPVYVNNAAAIHNHDPDPVTGWIDVEDDSRFTPIGNKLIKLRSTKLAGAKSYSNPVPNPDAGRDASVAPLLDVEREIHKFALRYQLEEDTGTGWVPIHDQTMDALVINNADILLWLELDEFLLVPMGVCQPITHTVTARYTVDHPHLDWYQIEIEKQSIHMSWPVPRVNYGGSLTFRGGHDASPTPTDVSAWDPCSYIVILSAHRRVTNGYGGPGVKWVYRTFCKG